MTVRGADAMGRSAVVFAPHPDDETLGCGGTILRKTGVGAEVSLVVMTDGKGSHRDLMDEGRIGEIRAREVETAASRLGIPAAKVHQFGFPDKGLDAIAGEPVKRVSALLEDARPDELYIPYLHDVTPDHVETRRVVLEAARSSLESVIVYEYPVWFWHHWPWVRIPLDNRRDLPMAVVENAMGVVHLIRDFNSCVHIGDVLTEKRHALEAHASQMTRLVDDERWARLGDVAGGEFLNCFFQEYEVFWERRLEGR
ncbi:MAG: PIG-L deacetylase family protein [Candidatus Latescibacterota bacterium]|jgi:LmbE family N-acetylglucosaminyl deacetylase